MALNWLWSERSGFLMKPSNNDKFEAYKINVYHGNAFAIFIWESEDTTYQLHAFFADKDHAKRCVDIVEDSVFYLWGKEDKRTVQLAKFLTEHRISVLWFNSEEAANAELEKRYQVISGV